MVTFKNYVFVTQTAPRAKDVAQNWRLNSGERSCLCIGDSYVTLLLERAGLSCHKGDSKWANVSRRDEIRIKQMFRCLYVL